MQLVKKSAGVNLNFLVEDRRYVEDILPEVLAHSSFKTGFAAS